MHSLSKTPVHSKLSDVCPENHIGEGGELPSLISYTSFISSYWSAQINAEGLGGVRRVWISFLHFLVELLSSNFLCALWRLGLSRIRCNAFSGRKSSRSVCHCSSERWEGALGNASLEWGLPPAHARTHLSERTSTVSEIQPWASLTKRSFSYLASPTTPS